MAVEDVQRSNGPSRRGVSSLGEFALSDQSADRLKVWASDHKKTIGLEHTQELGHCHRNFVWVQMLDIVAGINGIDRLGPHRRHVGHGANDIGLGRGVNVQPDFLPLGRVEATGRSVFALVAAADVEELFHMGFCLKARDALRKNPTPL